MAKQIREPFINYAAQMQKSLEQAGIDKGTLDKLMSASTVEKLLADKPAVFNYFKMANLGLDSLVNPKDLRGVAFALPTPDYYREYFDNQNPQAVPFFNYIPYQDIFDPQALGKNAGFRPEQIQGYTMILNATGNNQPEAAWGDVEGQGGSGKAMGTGTPSYGGTPAYGGTPTYGGGAGKAMSTGGSPQSKNLAPPGAPPGMGGPTGGYPPPGGGGPTGGGGLPPNWDPSAGTQWARDYVDQHLSNDPSYNGFQALFARSDMTNGMLAGLMEEQMREDSVKSRILTELQTLDARTPEGARRISMLNYEMQEINQNRSLRTDKMMTVKRYHDEFMSVFKNLMDTQNRTLEGIGRNLRQ